MNQIEIMRSGPGARRSLPLPDRLCASATDYALPTTPTFRYRLPAMSAFERFATMARERYEGPDRTAQSYFLTPQWKRMLEHVIARGLATHMMCSLPHDIEPSLYYFWLSLWPFDARHTDGDRPYNLAIARGSSTDYDTALSSCFGECLERTSLLLYRNAQLFTGSAPELALRGIPHLSPQTIDAFSQEQRAARHDVGIVHEYARYRWVRARRLRAHQAESGDVFVPAQLMFWKYRRLESEPKLVSMSTHGGAGYFTREGALLRSLYEWIQRDGFFSYWYRKAAPRRVDPESMPEGEARTLIEKTMDCGFKIHLLETTPADIPVPSVFCILTSTTSPVRISSGSGTNVDLSKAIHSAVQEALSIHHWLMEAKKDFSLPEPYDPFTHHFSDAERMSFWAAKSPHELDFFLKGEIRPFAEVRTAYPDSTGKSERDLLSHVAGLLTYSGHDIYYYEPAHSFLRELDYYVVKTYVTNMLMMHHDPREASLGTLARRLGTDAYRNRLPHLFP